MKDISGKTAIVTGFRHRHRHRDGARRGSRQRGHGRHPERCGRAGGARPVWHEQARHGGAGGRDAGAIGHRRTGSGARLRQAPHRLQQRRCADARQHHPSVAHPQPLDREGANSPFTIALSPPRSAPILQVRSGLTPFAPIPAVSGTAMEPRASTLGAGAGLTSPISGLKSTSGCIAVLHAPFRQPPIAARLDARCLATHWTLGRRPEQIAFFVMTTAQ
jgi:hypothetical protein